MHHQVSNYIECLPDTKREIAELLRELIYETVPHVEERFSFRLPFYHYYGMFCYINEVKDGIELCFCRGKDLVLAWPQLELKGRAMVASVLLRQVKEVTTMQIEQLLLQAADWNREARLLNKPMVRKKKTASSKKRS
jgi:hypothetical protein